MTGQNPPGASPTGSAYVLRALAASEIAESCSEPAIRQSFFELTATWLAEAERAFLEARREGRPDRPGEG